MHKIVLTIFFGTLLISVIQGCKTKKVQPTEDFTFDRFQSITMDYGDSLAKFSISENSDAITTDLTKTYYYFKSGELNHSQGYYTGKLLNGSYELIDQSDKSLIRKGEFEEGLMSGQWILWNREGKILEAYEYKKGEKQGKFMLNDGTGKPQMQGTYAGDVYHGKVSYFEADTVSMVIRYEKGIPKDTIQ